MKIIQISVNISILVSTSLILFAIGEVSYRAYHFIYLSIPFTASITDYKDESLGWKGKKVFEDFGSEKFRIFVVGDSFTDGLTVEQESMYYAVLKKRANASLFVYGGGGYGTFQEYLVIDRYIDQIKPDLVVLQLTSNDFINNYWKLESKSYVNNNQMVRPYYENGHTRYRYPRAYGRFRLVSATYSRLFYRLLVQIEIFSYHLAKRGIIKTVEKDIREKGMEYPPYRRAVAVTDAIIRMIQERIGTTPLVAFSVDGGLSLKQFERIFRERQIDFVKEIPQAIAKEEAKGAKLRLEDGSHWNEAGHQLAGNTLADSLKRKGYPF